MGFPSVPALAPKETTAQASQSDAITWPPVALSSDVEKADASGQGERGVSAISERPVMVHP